MDKSYPLGILSP